MKQKQENLIVKCAYGVIAVALLVYLCMIIPNANGEADNSSNSDETVTVEVDPDW